MRHIPDKVAISGPMLLVTELIVLACGVDAETNDASGSALTGGTLTSFKRHRNSSHGESPTKAANYTKIGCLLPACLRHHTQQITQSNQSLVPDLMQCAK